METRARTLTARRNSDIQINVIPGHFATNHSHVNYYVDMTSIKSRHRMAMEAAEALTEFYGTTTPVDTILCLEGTEMVGAFLAQQLAQVGVQMINENQDICVLTPELNSNNQMIFRDNTQKMVWDKNVLLLIASVSTGKTINRLRECLQYYNGKLVGISALFSAVRTVGETPINAIFTQEDLPDYRTFASMDCDYCQRKVKIDAIINSYGYSKI